jgi:hypothetical protein
MTPHKTGDVVFDISHGQLGILATIGPTYAVLRIPGTPATWTTLRASLGPTALDEQTHARQIELDAWKKANERLQKLRAAETKTST